MNRVRMCILLWIDKVGPFNYKGLVTPWEEPLDVYYMYRANYVPASEDPIGGTGKGQCVRTIPMDIQQS